MRWRSKGVRGVMKIWKESREKEAKIFRKSTIFARKKSEVVHLYLYFEALERGH